MERFCLGAITGLIATSLLFCRFGVEQPTPTQFDRFWNLENNGERVTGYYTVRNGIPVFHKPHWIPDGDHKAMEKAAGPMYFGPWNNVGPTVEPSPANPPLEGVAR